MYNKSRVIAELRDTTGKFISQEREDLFVNIAKILIKYSQR